jgi:serine/threonine protein kinase
MISLLTDMETTKTIVEQFLEEAVFLQDFHHPNVLPTVGVCWPPGTNPQVVLPYMANGDLRSLIKKDTLVCLY